MNRHAKALAVLVVVFACALPAYYLFSYGRNDGLQQTLDEGGSSGGGSVWTAPFSYGRNPVETFALGLAGLAVVFLVVYALLRVARRRGPRSLGP